MALELSRPFWLLLLIPACAGVYFMARRWPAAGIKARLSHIVHQMLVVLTVLAISGISVLAPAQEKAVWLVVDASGSMPDAVALAQQALDGLEEGTRAGVIVYGKNAMVELPLGEKPAFSGVQTAVDSSASDLNQALQLAGALLPGEVSGGIGVISDGLIDPVQAADLQARGIAVNTLQAAKEKIPDAQVTQVDLPSTAYQGQQFSMTAVVHSTAEGQAQLLLLENGTAAATQQVSLHRGENTFVFPAAAAASGVVTYEVQVQLPEDKNSRNDRLGAYMAVSGPPSVLLAEGGSGQGAELRKMLEASGMQVTLMPAASLPAASADYMTWQAIALVNVDADTLTQGQTAALMAAARELGRGVAVFGGDSSYALGGYRGSQLETMLPVTIDVKNKLNLPSTALVLVIDKSGSMTSGQYGVTRLDVAKEAACRAIEVLTEKDTAGVIAFDDHGKWALPMTQVTDIAAMQEQVGTIRPGGGTAFYTPLAMALDALESTSAQHKHVIFLTDGESGDQGYEQLVEQMAQQGITLTAVAIGAGADTRTMLRLAELGGGRAYAAAEFDNVPKIFTKETLLAAETFVQNRTFTPVITDGSMTDFSGFPQLAGYLTTTEKPLATVSLASDREEPILAWWQYGASRVACWTSDVQGAWSSAFLQWGSAAEFFSGIISHVLPAWNQQGDLSLQEGILTYTAANSMESASLEARVLAPDGQTITLPMEQTGAAAFTAPWDSTEPGAYAVQIASEGQTLLEGGAVLPYAREYDLRVSDRGALAALSQSTGGQAVDDPAALLSFPHGSARTRRPLTPVLMLLALLLLLADIAQRRLNRCKALPAPAPKARTPKARPEKKKTQQPAGQTAQQLWESMQKKKRL